MADGRSFESKYGKKKVDFLQITKSKNVSDVDQVE